MIGNTRFRTYLILSFWPLEHTVIGNVSWHFWIGSFYSLPVFVQHVTVVPIEARQQFKESYAALPQLAAETYRECSKDVPQIDRK